MNSTMKRYVERHLFSGNLGEVTSQASVPEAVRHAAKKSAETTQYPSQIRSFEYQSQRYFAVLNAHDGGLFVDLFTRRGREIGGGAYGESTPFRWEPSAKKA